MQVVGRCVIVVVFGVSLKVNSRRCIFFSVCGLAEAVIERIVDRRNDNDNDNVCGCNNDNNNNINNSYDDDDSDGDINNDQRPSATQRALVALIV